MREDTKYNGWTNYETWLFALWFDNYFNEDAMSELDNSEPRYDWEDKKSAAVAYLEEYIKEYAESYLEESVAGLSGFFADLMNSAIDRIDFREIAQSVIDENYDEWLENNPQDEEKSEESEEE